MAICIHEAEVGLTTGIALVRSLAIPLHRQRIVLRHALAICIHEAEVVLSVGIALVRSLAKPLHCPPLKGRQFVF